MVNILINDDTLKKMDINEKSILVLKMPYGVSAEDVKIAMDAVQKTGRDSINKDVGVLILPHDHEVEKLDLQSLILLKARVDSLLICYTKQIIDAKAKAES